MLIKLKNRIYNLLKYQYSVRDAHARFKRGDENDISLAWNKRYVIHNEAKASVLGSLWAAHLYLKKLNGTSLFAKKDRCADNLDHISHFRMSCFVRALSSENSFSARTV